MAKKTRKKKLLLWEILNLNKHTIGYWLVLFAFCGALMAVELGKCHHLLGLNNLPFWKSIISPLSHEVKENFLNLYISQISTTFLVTAFLSFLGDKDAAIYWTTAMDYKLVHPKGSSLRDLTSYSFCTLAISFLAIVLKTRLCFLFSFLINIWFLVIITWRMIITFYNRDGIKIELKELFEQKSQQEQQEDLRTMEENMVRAAHDHDIEYLRECKEFLEAFISDKEIKALQKDEQEIRALITALDEIVEKCNAYLENRERTLDDGNRLGKAVSPESKELASRLRDKLTKAFEKNQIHKPEQPKMLTDPSRWDVPDYVVSAEAHKVTEQLKSIAGHIRQIADLAENPLWVSLAFDRARKINDNAFHASMLRYINIVPHQFAELQLSGMQAICRGIGMSDLVVDNPILRKARRKLYFEQALNHRALQDRLHFPIVFALRERTIYLLRKNTQTLPGPTTSLGLDMLIAFHLAELEPHIRYALSCKDDILDFTYYFTDFVGLFQEAYNNRSSIDPYAKAISALCDLISCGLRQISGTPDRDPLPPEIAKRLHFFSDSEAITLFNGMCDKRTLFDDYYECHTFLENVCKYTHPKSDALKEELGKILQQASQLGDDRGYCLTFLDD